MTTRTGIKLTPEVLKSHIAEVIYEDREVGGHRAITCHFKMDNGFVVHGTKPSTSIDPANFDEALGKEISYNNTFDQLWQLEAYRALVEQDLLAKATETAEIRIDQYAVERSALCPAYHLGFNVMIQDVMFRAENGERFLASFVCGPDDMELVVDSHNAKSRKAVSDFLCANSKVDLTYSPLVLRIAKICHEANRAYCKSVGDDSQLPWEQSPAWQRESACKGVIFHLTGDRKPSESHESWMAEKEAEGWVYGPVKDPQTKQHPCMVPYGELPVQQRSKDYIFKSIVDSFK
ncbi:hypothetical protein SeF6a_040 [Salmonella phage SeF6a]|nr:hypothetical protein SeF6a_040 [Salmonella phage SeF6a]